MLVYMLLNGKGSSNWLWETCVWSCFLSFVCFYFCSHMVSRVTREAHYDMTNICSLLFACVHLWIERGQGTDPPPCEGLVIIAIILLPPPPPPPLPPCTLLDTDYAPLTYVYEGGPSSDKSRPMQISDVSLIHMPGITDYQ